MLTISHLDFLNQYSKPVLLTEGDNQPFFVNTAFTQLTGYGYDHDTSVLKDLISPFNETERATNFREVIFITQTGKKLPLSVSVSEINLPNGSSFRVYTLDDNIQLSTCRKELERLNEEQEEFSYVASHDLQSPMRTVASYVQLLRKSIDAGQMDRAREFMDFVKGGVDNMQLLIDGLLQFSRVNRKGNAMSSVDVNDLIAACETILKAKIQAKNVQITSDKMPLIHGDSAQITLLFRNLLDNAIKFVENGKTPVIYISVKERSDDYLFSVKDNGIGIEEKYYERVFGIFQRLHNQSEFEGTGAGLAICKRIVERHGGEIGVESQKGVGSVFFFTIKK